MRPPPNTARPELPLDPQMVWQFTHLYGRAARTHPCWKNPKLLRDIRDHIQRLSDHIDTLTLRIDEVSLNLDLIESMPEFPEKTRKLVAWRVGLERGRRNRDNHVRYKNLLAWCLKRSLYLHSA